jgi:hypothetical protein
MLAKLYIHVYIYLYKHGNDIKLIFNLQLFITLAYSKEFMLFRDLRPHVFCEKIYRAVCFKDLKFTNICYF